MMKKSLIITSIILFLDLLSKYLLFSFLDLNKSYVIINNFFYISPLKNIGAAFSILENNNILLITISVIILIYLIVSIKNKKDKLLNYLSYGLLIGGLLGNLFDRIVFSYVRDFLSLNIFGYNFPVFNIADIAIVIGAFILFYTTFKGDKYEV